MTSAVLIYPFGFIKGSWVVFLMLMSHLHCLYVMSVNNFRSFFFGYWSFLYWVQEALHILGKQLSIWIAKFFPSLLFVFWLCGNLFSHKEDIVFNVNELFEFVFYGFFVHINNNPDVRCVWIQICISSRWLPCLLNNQSFSILIWNATSIMTFYMYLFFLVFLFISTDSFICDVDLILFHWSYLIIYIW